MWDRPLIPRSLSSATVVSAPPSVLGVWNLGFCVLSLGFEVCFLSLGFEILGLGFGFWVLGFGFWVLGVRFGIQGLRYMGWCPVLSD